jgi:hypothetical protein
MERKVPVLQALLANQDSHRTWDGPLLSGLTFRETVSWLTSNPCSKRHQETQRSLVSVINFAVDRFQIRVQASQRPDVTQCKRRLCF